MKKNKILIISYYWPPSGGSGVQRWLNFSNYLISYGWDVTVLTAKNPNFPITDKSLSRILNKSVKHIYVPIFEPTLFFNQQTSFLNTNSKGFISRIIYFIRSNIFFPDSRCFWIKKATNMATNFIKENNVNYLITTAPPFSTHIIGLKLKEKLKINWISDFRDPWSDFFQFKLMPMMSIVRKRHKFYEKKCLQNSDIVITTSPSLTMSYSNFNDNAFTVTNGFENYVKKVKSKKFLICYSGMMNNVQNPSKLWKVLFDLSIENREFRNDLEVRMIGSFGNEIRNDTHIKKLNGKVKFKNYMDKEKLDSELSSAQVLIVCSINQKNTTIIPGKLFYYFSFRTNIVAFENSNGDIARILDETKSGKLFDFKNYDDLKKHIFNLYVKHKAKRELKFDTKYEKYMFSNLSKKLDLILKNIS